MTDGKKRRRRGRRGRGGGAPAEGQSAAPEQPAELPAATSEAEQLASRAGRRDTRRAKTGVEPPAPRAAIRRAPPPGPGEREARRRRRDEGGRGREGGAARERGPRAREERRGFEPPVPQDPRSLELGAAFREAQQAVRDARRALEKRRAEHGDEPEWLVEQLADAERRFAAAADAWVQHLDTTGRKVVRAR
jgi:hypothetical protein